MNVPIKKCPYCGCDDEFYIKTQVSGTMNYYYNFDGTTSDNSSSYEQLKYKDSKYAYCVDCNKRLFEIIE